MTSYSRYKDFIYRKDKQKNQMNLLILKSFLLDSNLSKTTRFKIMLKMNDEFSLLLGNKLQSRCIYSSKIRSVSRISNLTKASFKNNLHWGKVNGFRKSSW